MELPATSERQITFQDFPAEILAKIFVDTLPDDALEKRQPNVRISPLLLCHVCSRWRSIALQLPRLWMCLYCLVRIPSYILTESGLLRRGIHPISREFLEWWWCNLGKNYPFHFRLHSGFEPSSCNPLRVPEFFDPGKEFVQDHILVTLFNLAQHLDIDHNKAWMIHRCPELTFPNLETLRIRKDPNASSLPQWIYALRSERPIPKLHFQDFDLTPAFLEKPTISWSSLTHLVFDVVRLSTGTWFDLIRSCVNLEFGHFELRMPYYSEDLPFPNPSHFTHHHLRRLVIGWDDHDGGYGQYMLKNLFLPSLTAFRISAQLTAPKLHRILESTPSLVELHLGRKVAPNNIWYWPGHDEDHLPDSLSRYALNVRHLVVQIDLYENMGRLMKDIIDNLFSSSWLQLGEPTNNVRTLEIRAMRYLAMDLRRELDVKLAQNPMHGLKTTVVRDDEPLLWESYTISDKRSFRHFEETNFGGRRERLSEGY